MRKRPILSAGVMLSTAFVVFLMAVGLPLWRLLGVCALGGRALEHLEADDTDRALRSARWAVRIAPQNGLAWAILACVRDERQEWQEAETAYRRAVALKPDEPRILDGLGWFLWRSGRDAEAKLLYERALKLDPQHSYGLLCLGALHQYAGRPTEAAECCQKAISLGSGDDYAGEAHNMMGYLHAQRGDWEEALREVETALSLEPDNATFLDSKGAIATLSGDLQTGEADLRRAIAAPDAEDCSRATLAYCLARQGRDDEARGELAAISKGLVLQGPKMDTSSLYFAARAYGELRERDRAAELAEAFVRRWPKHPWAKDMRKLLQKAPPDRPDPPK